MCSELVVVFFPPFMYWKTYISHSSTNKFFSTALCSLAKLKIKRSRQNKWKWSVSDILQYIYQTSLAVVDAYKWKQKLKWFVIISLNAFSTKFFRGFEVICSEWVLKWSYVCLDNNKMLFGVRSDASINFDYSDKTICELICNCDCQHHLPIDCKHMIITSSWKKKRFDEWNFRKKENEWPNTNTFDFSVFLLFMNTWRR